MLFVIFILIPIIEISVLLEVGHQIGGWMTIALVILTAAVGATLVRSQGVRTLLNAQQKIRQGQQPGQELVEGIMLAISGVMLVTPGFITDLLGLSLLLPVSRQFLAKQLLTRMVLNTMGQQGAGANYGFSSSSASTDSDIIDGECVNKDHEVQLSDKRDR